MKKVVGKLKTGESFEKLVAHLERVLAGNDDVTVEQRKKLLDRTTGRKREHDVVLTIRRAHHEAILAIECRDRSRPVGVNQVEGFYKKCEDTNVNQGLIVSSSGFYKSARIKAEFLGIRCLDLEETTSFNWLLAPGLIVCHLHIKHTNWTLIPTEDVTEKPTNFSLLNEDGEEVSKEILVENVRRKLPQLNILSRRPGMFRDTLVFGGDGLFVKDESRNVRIPLKKLVAVVEYEVTSELTPFDLVKYSDKEKGPIADAAFANFKAGDVSGKVMIVCKYSEGGGNRFHPRR
jgi:hypothetical protein